MLITFWSSAHGQAATTTNIVAVSLMTALEYRFKILLTHNHFQGRTLEASVFDKRYLSSQKNDPSSIGLDGLSRYIKFNKIDKENFSNFTTTLLKNRLDILFGTNKTNEELFNNELRDVIGVILSSAKNYYDLIFFDLPSDESHLSKPIIEASDCIVINLNQNLHLLEGFFESFQNSLEKCFFIIGMYDKESRYNLKVLKRKYKSLKDAVVIPYSRQMADACNEGKAVDFLLRNLEATKDDINYNFIKELRNTTRQLLSSTGIDIHLKKLGD